MSTILSYKIHTVTPYINWIYFFHAWGFQPRFAAIANIHGCDACRASWLTTFPEEERNKASEAMQLFKEANRLQTGKRRFLLFLNSCPENCEVQNSGQRKNCRYKVRAELEIISL